MNETSRLEVTRSKSLKVVTVKVIHKDKVVHTFKCYAGKGEFSIEPEVKRELSYDETNCPMWKVEMFVGGFEERFKSGNYNAYVSVADDGDGESNVMVIKHLNFIDVVKI